MYIDENIIQDKAIKLMLDKYIEDLSSNTNEKLYAVFDIIKKNYENTNKCPICSDKCGHTSYGSTKIACERNMFAVLDGVINLCIPANYCPICGKKLNE